MNKRAKLVAEIAAVLAPSDMRAANEAGELAWSIVRAERLIALAEASHEQNFVEFARLASAPMVESQTV